MTNTTCHKVRHKFQLKYVHVKYISSQAQISQFIIIIIIIMFIFSAFIHRIQASRMLRTIITFLNTFVSNDFVVRHCHLLTALV